MLTTAVLPSAGTLYTRQWNTQQAWPMFGQGTTDKAVPTRPPPQSAAPAESCTGYAGRCISAAPVHQCWSTRPPASTQSARIAFRKLPVQGPLALGKIVLVVYINRHTADRTLRCDLLCAAVTRRSATRPCCLPCQKYKMLALAPPQLIVHSLPTRLQCIIKGIIVIN